MSIGLAVGLHLGRGGAVGPQRVAYDTFTDANGTALTSHTPDSGGSWSKHSASGAGDVTIDGNRAHNPNASVLQVAYHSLTPTTADYRVEADVVLVTANNSLAGVCARINPAATTYYVFRYYTNGARWQLYRFVAGAFAQLGSDVVQSLNALQVYRAAIDVRGSSIVCTVDGATVIAVTDANITDAGRPGLLLQFNQTSAAGVHLDTWSVLA